MIKKIKIASSTASPRNDKATVKNGKIESVNAVGREQACLSPTKSVLCMLMVAVLLPFCGAGYAAEVTAMGAAAGTEVVEPPFHIKEVSGVMVASTRFNLSIQTSQDGFQAFEMLMPINRNTKLRGYRNFKEITRGDTIKVVYKQSYEMQKDGSERVVGTVATEISLIKSRQQGKLTSKEM